MRALSRYSPIADYALIGDCRSAALVSRDGSLDWLCRPRFDGPSVFGALVDAERGGRFSVRPSAPTRCSRRYLPDSNVLETTFVTDGGVARLTDCMPVAGEPHRLWAEHEVLRRLEGIEGRVAVEVVWDPRPGFGGVVPRIVDRGPLGLLCAYRSGVLVLRSDLPVQPVAGGPGAYGSAVIDAGDRCYLSMTSAGQEPAVLPALGPAAAAKLAATDRWWRSWAGHCTYAGAHRDAVVRSALALKLLTFSPSGAVVAAPTTSLPERLGGERNWDYRYCWLRDASLLTRALHDLGYPAESEAFLGWLLHATRLTLPELQVLYSVYGETRLPERELAHLDGYACSRPVRIGNDAKDQLQLDVYGEVVDAAFQHTRRGGRLDRAGARMLVGLGKTVCRRWTEPDEGIWEIRAERRHHTLSKAMGWLALDRLLSMHEEGRLRAPVRDFEAAREAIRRAVETDGYSERLGSYVAVFGGDDVDASLLLLGLHGYADPGSPRMRGTHARILERLGVDGLLYRYRSPDGLRPGEGAFGICSFWSIEQHARQGDLERATSAFEHLLSFANDVGLYAEEIEPGSGAALGNFPQAFTHAGLIGAALTLETVRGGRR
ncbi:MAG: glycoside hydrolase family 15 protein [Longimicrobiales bacterium]